MMALSLVFWLVIIYLAWRFLVRRESGTGPQTPPRNRALDILDERFAKGEIDKKEYEERKAELLK